MLTALDMVQDIRQYLHHRRWDLDGLPTGIARKHDDATPGKGSGGRMGLLGLSHDFSDVYEMNEANEMNVAISGQPLQHPT